MGFLDRPNSRSRAIAVLAGGAGALVVVGLGLAALRPSPGALPTPAPTPRQAPTPTATPPQTVVPLDISEQLNLGRRDTNAMAVSPGIVWLATQGVTSSAAGTLIRVDATTARETASWSIGEDPVAVASGGNFVWVANATGGGPASVPGQNTVEQFNATTGALVHTYRVPDPQGIVANPSSALVISSNAGQQTAIGLLSDGTTTPVSILPGIVGIPMSSLSPEVAVVVCAHEVVLALTSMLTTGSHVTIYALPPTGGTVRTVATILDDYGAAMTCDNTSLFVIGAAGDGDASIARVSLTDGGFANLWEGPYPVSVAFLAGRVWIAYSDDALNQSALTSIDPATGVLASTRSILPSPPNSGDPSLLVPDDSGLWLVASQGNEVLHIATG
jgi:hypothetical protein